MFTTDNPNIARISTESIRQVAQNKGLTWNGSYENDDIGIVLDSFCNHFVRVALDENTHEIIMLNTVYFQNVIRRSNFQSLVELIENDNSSIDLYEYYHEAFIPILHKTGINLNDLKISFYTSVFDFICNSIIELNKLEKVA